MYPNNWPNTMQLIFFWNNSQALNWMRSYALMFAKQFGIWVLTVTKTKTKNINFKNLIWLNFYKIIKDNINRKLCNKRDLLQIRNVLERHASDEFCVEMAIKSIVAICTNGLRVYILFLLIKKIKLVINIEIIYSIRTASLWRNRCWSHKYHVKCVSKSFGLE